MTPALRRSRHILDVRDRTYRASKQVEDVILNQDVPAYFPPMLLDAERNEAFRTAISFAVNRQKGDLRVIDLGCGTGLLSVFVIDAAVKADKGCTIYGIEANAYRASLARNNVSRKIESYGRRQRTRLKFKVVEKLSTKATLPDIENEQCNLLVTETLGTFPHYEKQQIWVSDLLGRGILRGGAFTVPARQRLTVTPYVLRSDDAAVRMSDSGVATVYEDLCKQLSPPCAASFRQDREFGLSPHASILKSDGAAFTLFDEDIRINFSAKNVAVSLVAAQAAHRGCLRFLVAEWECDMGDGSRLSNTVDAVSRLSPHNYVCRLNNWGFNLLPLPPGAVTLNLRVTRDGVDVVPAKECGGTLG